MVPGRNRDEDQMKRLETERREKEACQRKIGQLAMQIDWLEKICGIARAGLSKKVALLQSHPGRTERKGLSERCVASLPGVSRSAAYHKETPTSADELGAKGLIDRIRTGNLAWGSRQIRSQLRHAGHRIGRRKVQRYMKDMGIHATCPKPNLSCKAHGAQVVPYLLRNVEITRPNQAWSTDITYIPMSHGFMYLTAVPSWHTRCVVGWELGDTLCTRSCIGA